MFIRMEFNEVYWHLFSGIYAKRAALIQYTTGLMEEGKEWLSKLLLRTGTCHFHSYFISDSQSFAKLDVKEQKCICLPQGISVLWCFEVSKEIYSQRTGCMIQCGRCHSSVSVPAKWGQWNLCHVALKRK